MKKDNWSLFWKWMKFSSSCTFFIILFAERSFAQDLETDNVIADVQELGVVSNITARAFYDEDMDDIHLLVTWKNPPGSDTRLQKWRIAQNLFFDDGNKYCHRGIASQDVEAPSDSTSVIIQKDHYPNCTYKIEIVGEEMDTMGAMATRHIIYTVPECVDDKCICHYQGTKPQGPDIKVEQISTDLIRIFWKIPELTNVSTISFMVLPSASFKIIASLKRNVTAWCASGRCYDDVVVPGMTIGTSYTVDALYEDALHCESESESRTFQAKEIAESQLAYQVMISLMFVIMFMLLLWLIWKRKDGCLRDICLSSSSYLKRIDINATGRSCKRMNIAVPMEYNNIYIEKETSKTIDEYEMSYTQLHLGSEIGNGAFGQVFLARLPPFIIVAVKTLKENASTEELENFLLEIAMLKQIGRHPNIVTLFGCCTIQQPYCIVMEYIPCGDLLHYLHGLRTYYERNNNRFCFNHDPLSDHSSTENKEKVSEDSSSVPPSIPFNRLPSITETVYTDLNSPGALQCVLEPRDLQNFAVQIARGMRHLEQKQIVHRDLAARNVLIDENKTLKISDFGLSRQGVYVNSKQKKVPLRWMSVEAIRDRLYTSKSDVWAYGIVLWEIGTLGGFPYPNISNDDILSYLLSGKRMEKPENCTDELYALMLRSWSANEDERPTFTDLLKDLEAISSKRRVYVDFSQLNPVYMFPPKTKICGDVSASSEHEAAETTEDLEIVSEKI